MRLRWLVEFQCDALTSVVVFEKDTRWLEIRLLFFGGLGRIIFSLSIFQHLLFHLTLSTRLGWRFPTINLSFDWFNLSSLILMLSSSLLLTWCLPSPFFMFPFGWFVSMMMVTAFMPWSLLSGVRTFLLIRWVPAMLSLFLFLSLLLLFLSHLSAYTLIYILEYYTKLVHTKISMISNHRQLLNRLI